MEKRRVCYLLICLMMMSFLTVVVSAEKIGIEVENNYSPGEEVGVKFVLYNDNNEKIDGTLDFQIQNYYTEVINEGDVNSGEEVNFKLPENAIRGLWKISADYNGLIKEAWFDVGELEKVIIKLEGDKLIITNVGNVPYRKPISISIGDHSETALVGLEVGQIKEIILTAPEGEYDVFVSDGTEENTLEVKGVPLTGNVVGLKNGSINSFWSKYPMVSLFLGVLLLVVVAVVVLKFMQGGININIKNINKNK